MVAKIMIVLIAFPAFVHAIYTVVTVMLNLVQPGLLSLAGNWAEVLRWSLMGTALLIAVRGSFGMCRRLWPSPVPAK
jgi:hypothetical protein